MMTRPTLRRIGSDLETVVTNQKGGALRGRLFNARPLCAKTQQGERVEGTESDSERAESDGERAKSVHERAESGRERAKSGLYAR